MRPIDRALSSLIASRSLRPSAVFLAFLMIWMSGGAQRLVCAAPADSVSRSSRSKGERIPLVATPNPNAFPNAKAEKAGVATPEPSDETLSRLMRMRSRLQNLRVDTRWIGGEEVTQNFTATVGQGTLRGKGEINWSRPERVHWARVEVSEVDVPAFLHVCDIRFDGKVQARVSGTLDLRWRGMRFRDMRATMEGGGKLHVSSGTVTSTRLLDQVAAFSGLPELRRFEFREGLVIGRIRDGRVDIESIEFRNPDYILRAKGSVRLEDGALDARVELRVRPSLAMRSQLSEVRLLGVALAAVSQDSPDGMVAIPLPLSFGGTLERPIPYLELGATPPPNIPPGLSSGMKSAPKK
ncbi:MAG: hypothetical protein KatS3mg130_0313 [Candidatus Sumerlaea sp.]|nr:MAG: hypothetical protein KatS3mg130_0313 [Candidatus Sumerlaea sp.]